MRMEGAQSGQKNSLVKRKGVGEEFKDDLGRMIR